MFRKVIRLKNFEKLEESGGIILSSDKFEFDE